VWWSVGLKRAIENAKVTMNRALITFDDLQALTGYTRPADVERCLKKQGVTVIIGRDGRPATTIEALNQALGVRQDKESPPRIEF